MNPQILNELARQQTREIRRAASRRARSRQAPVEDPWAEVQRWLSEAAARPRPDRVTQR
jgi:hypothetical protein